MNAAQHRWMEWLRTSLILIVPAAVAVSVLGGCVPHLHGPAPVVVGPTPPVVVGPVPYYAHPHYVVPSHRYVAPNVHGSPRYRGPVTHVAPSPGYHSTRTYAPTHRPSH
jgi:hypothetical protein